MSGTTQHLTLNLIDHAESDTGCILTVPINGGVFNELDFDDVLDSIQMVLKHCSRRCVVDPKQDGQVISRSSIVRLDRPLHVRVIKTWNQALKFLRTKPDRSAFYRYFNNDAADIEVVDEEGKQQAALRDLPNQWSIFWLSLNIHSTGVGCPSNVRDLNEVDYLANADQVRGESTVFMTELVCGIERPETFLPILQASLDPISRMMPDALVRLVRDYCVSSLLKECLELVNASVRIFIGQQSWKLRVFDAW